MPVYLLATLDTKGPEAEYVRERLQALGVAVTVVDCGCVGPPAFRAEIDREAVFAAAGTSRQALVAQSDRGTAVQAAAEGAARIVAQAFAAGAVSGVLALGGSAGTTIGTAAMRGLPLGVPKIMVSTLASGQVRPWVGDKDIWMLNSVVDLAGINRISRKILGAAAAAMAGLVRHGGSASENAEGTTAVGAATDRPLIAATMFGVTTPCVQHARGLLEAAGYEVLVFHATGSGGQAMESLIREGLIAGVLDITTTELADELVGGILSAGPTRLTAAGERGLPQVVSVGALDMVNFGPRETVPPRFAGRQFHVHNASVTLMRTTPEENAALGAEIGRKLTAARGPRVVLLPRHGVSALDRAGQPFDDPQARTALFAALRGACQGFEIVECNAHVNDPAFAEAAATTLLALLRVAELRSG